MKIIKYKKELITKKEDKKFFLAYSKIKKLNWVDIQFIKLSVAGCILMILRRVKCRTTGHKTHI